MADFKCKSKLKGENARAECIDAAYVALFKMKKMNFNEERYQGYSSPSVESLDLSVEQGFALSEDDLFGPLPGEDDWDYNFNLYE